MRSNDLISRFPNASAAFIRANTKADGALQYAEPECDPTPALEPVAEGKKEGFDRITVRFIGKRVRPLDPDNFAGSIKDLLDGLRRANLIPSDEWKEIRLETEQVKVGSREQERTEIELIYP